MSVESRKWASAQRVGSQGAKHVLVTLAGYANDNTGECWPGIATLSQECEMSERTVRTHITFLESREFLVRGRRSSKSGRLTDLYTLSQQPAKPATGKTSNRQNTVPATGKNGHGDVQNLPVAYKEEPSIEPSIEPSSMNKAPVAPPEENATTPISELVGILSSLDGWKRYGQSTSHIRGWLESKRIDVDHAVGTALALKAKWGGKGWTYKDPWATFQTWARRPPLNQVSRHEPTPRQNDPSKYTRLKQEIEERQRAHKAKGG